MLLENVKGAIWDFDGTMVDSYKLFVGILGEVVVETDHAMPSEEILMSNYHGSLRDTFKAILNIDSEAEVDRVVESFKEKQTKMYNNGDDSLFFEDSIHLSQRMAEKGIPQIIITNRMHEGSGPASPRTIIESSLVAPYINEVRCHEEVVIPKPDPSAVGSWFHDKGIALKDVVVIGDQEVDRQLAENIGARALMIARNGIIPHLAINAPNLYVVSSLHEVEI